MAKKNNAPEAARQNKNGNTLPAARPNQQLQTQTSAPVGGRGFENVERKDILIPRIQLLQALSPAVTNDIAKAGTMHVNLTNRNYGGKVVITPILHFRSRIKWLPKDDGGGIECSSPDARKPVSDLISPDCASCRFTQWDDSKKGKEQAPACTLYENFLVLVNDETEPVLLPMERTKLKAAKKLYSMGALKNADMWAWQYELSVSKEKNDKDQPYYNYVITDLAKRTDPKRMDHCEKIWTALSKKTIVTDINTDDDAAAAPATGAAPDDSDKY